MHRSRSNASAIRRAAILLAVLPFLALPPSGASARGRADVITWAPDRLDLRIASGDVVDVPVTFRTAEPLRHVDVWVSPSLQAFVEPVPAHLEHVEPWAPHAVVLRIAAPRGSRGCLHEGAILLRTRTQGRPQMLRVRLAVDGAVNHPPVANAGAAQTVAVGAHVTLDGTASTDDEGAPLSYRWSLVSVPDGSQAWLAGASTARPTFVVDEPGQYVAQLVVNDGRADSQPALVTVSTLNSAPVARAGDARTARVGDVVTLDGTGSSDVDGDPLAYRWTFTSVPPESAATLSDATSPSPSFVVDRPGEYEAWLVVNDGTVDGAPAVVTVSTVNSPPLANAGPDQTAYVNDTVRLSAAASTDPDGDRLAFAWSFTARPDGSAATLSDPTATEPAFTVDVPGVYVLQLVAADGTTVGVPDTVTVSTLNSPPVANAGADLTAPLGETVQLDGTGSSDVDGDHLAFAWAFTTRPAGSVAALADPTAARPTFVVDAPGTYVVQLVVRDGTAASPPATVRISTLNTAPVADAGPARSAAVGATVVLDGSGSRDADGDPLTYAWSIVALPDGSAAALSDAAAASPWLAVDRPGTYVVQLVVNDGHVDGAPVTVTVTTTNAPPLARALAAADVPVMSPVTLDGSASSDPDGDSLSFSWALTVVPAGSAATIAAVDLPSPTFVPDLPGLYLAQLVVNDGQVSSAPVTVAITAHPRVTAALPGTMIAVYAPRSVAVSITLSAPAPAGGVPVTFTIDDPSVAAVAAATVVPAGQTRVTVPVTGVAAGSTRVRASSAWFAGVSQAVRVTAATFALPAAIPVGKDLQASFTISVAVAPPPTGGTITVVSTDPAKVLLATSATAPGARTVTVSVLSTATSPRIWVQALDAIGTVQLTATSDAYVPASGGARLAPSGFVLASPAFTTGVAAGTTAVSLSSVLLDPATLASTAAQAVRPGLTVAVPVASSDPSVGTLTVSPVTFTAASATATTAFSPVAAGTATISVETPPGFATPATGQSITATVAQ